MILTESVFIVSLFLYDYYPILIGHRRQILYWTRNLSTGLNYKILQKIKSNKLTIYNIFEIISLSPMFSDTHLTIINWNCNIRFKAQKCKFIENIVVSQSGFPRTGFMTCALYDFILFLRQQLFLIHRVDHPVIADHPFPIGNSLQILERIVGRLVLPAFNDNVSHLRTKCALVRCTNAISESLNDIDLDQL